MISKESRSIGLSCLLGAFVGTFAAMEIASRFEYGYYLWGIGAVLGGIVAYIAIDFRYFCTGVARAKRKAAAEFVVGYQTIRDWRPNRYYWSDVWYDTKLFWRFAFWHMLACWAVASLIAACGYLLTLTPFGGIPNLGYRVLILSPVVAALTTIMLPAFLFCWEPENGRYYWRREKRQEKIETLKEFSLQVNAIYWGWVTLVGFAIVIRSILYAIPKIPGWWRIAHPVIWLGLKSTANFMGYAFAHVHSQRRTICFVDAALGSMIGYTFGSAILGAAAGALLGILNYEIVSLRVLKLTPATRTN